MGWNMGAMAAPKLMVNRIVSVPKVIANHGLGLVRNFLGIGGSFWRLNGFLMFVL